MSTTISNPVQHLSVIPKELEQPNLAKQESKTEKSQEQNPDIAQETKDSIEIGNTSQRSVKSKQDRDEIKDVDEAQKSVKEVVELINSESGNPPVEQVHNLDPGSLVDLLA